MAAVDDVWRTEATADYICDKAYAIVTTQFPDELLKHAIDVSTRLQRACNTRGCQIQVYILADTTYNSLSVDEVAASHVKADCVVHYGRASLTPLSRIPAYYVFPEEKLDAHTVADALLAHPPFAEVSAGCGTDEQVVVFLDQPYLESVSLLHKALTSKRPALSRTLMFAEMATYPGEPCCRLERQPPGNDVSACCGAGNNYNYTHIPRSPNSLHMAGYTWPNHSTVTSCGGGGAETAHGRNKSFVWIGQFKVPALTQLQLTYNAATWLCYDPSANSAVQGLLPETAVTLRRRAYLFQRTRDANIIGILVGTLGAAGYADVIQKVRHAAHAAGKKSYTLLMGKPNPAKLANFPEIDVFVMVSDPQGQILDSKEYLAPIVTPHEAMMAFDEDSEWTPDGYRLDFDGVLGNGRKGENSLGDPEPNGTASNALVAQAQRALQVVQIRPGTAHLVEARSAADFLVHKRSWKGVEAPLVGAQPKQVETAAQGRAGRAAGYTAEGE